MALCIVFCGSLMNVFTKYKFTTNGWMGYMLVVLLVGSCLAIWSCASSSKDAYIDGRSPGYSSDDQLSEVEKATPPVEKASPQGGILIGNDAEPPYVTEETESGEAALVDGETAPDNADIFLLFRRQWPTPCDDLRKAENGVEG